MPRARKDSSRASVPLATPTQCAAPLNSANSPSKASPSSPRTYQPLAIILSTAWRISAAITAVCRARSFTRMRSMGTDPPFQSGRTLSDAQRGVRLRRELSATASISGTRLRPMASGVICCSSLATRRGSIGAAKTLSIPAKRASASPRGTSAMCSSSPSTISPMAAQSRVTKSSHTARILERLVGDDHLGLAGVAEQSEADIGIGDRFGRVCSYSIQSMRWMWGRESARSRWSILRLLAGADDCPVEGPSTLGCRGIDDDVDAMHRIELAVE